MKKKMTEVIRLPTYKGYTVDARLREFRKLEFGKVPEFIPFDSPKGRELLEGWKATRVSNPLTPEEIKTIEEIAARYMAEGRFKDLPALIEHLKSMDREFPGHRWVGIPVLLPEMIEYLERKERWKIKPKAILRPQVKSAQESISKALSNLSDARIDLQEVGIPTPSLDKVISEVERLTRFVEKLMYP